MEEKKIAVIIQKTNEKLCAATVKSINQLAAPEGYKVEILTVKSASRFIAYDTAMKKMDAKYKIYIDEQVEVVQKNIFEEVLKIFQSDEKIGVVGVSGAIKLSTSGVCINSAKRCGKIFLGIKKGVKDWKNITEDFREVEAVDGFFFATQYDIDWRQDLFKKNTFGETAQCLEFKRRGYKSVVLNSKTPAIWCKTSKFAIDETGRKNFLQEYSAELFPLVSVIIPTFNRPKYFKLALESALNQTYRNIEVVISDNSTEDDTENLVKEFMEKDPRIKYFRHQNFNADDNWNFARHYNNPDAEFVNWLMDDDMYYPKKIEMMMEVYRNNPDISLVTSMRDFVDMNGKPIKKSRQVMKMSGKMDGQKAGSLLFISDNYIGEPTTVLIKKEFLRDNDLCWLEDETGFFSLVDASTWLQLLTKGDLYWIKEPLSAMRLHEGQATFTGGTGIIMVICWARLMKTAWEKKVFLKTEDEIRRAFIHWMRILSLKLSEAQKAKYHGEEVSILEDFYIAMAKALNNGYNIELPPIKYSGANKFTKTA